MTLWHSKEIDVTLQVSKNGVGIFVDVECTAHVAYDSVGGEIEWEVTGFEFGDKNGRTTIDKRDDVIFNLLMSSLNDDDIKESVAEEFSYSRDVESGYVNRAWVTRRA